MTTKPTKTAAKKTTARGKVASADKPKIGRPYAYRPEYCDIAVETLAQGHSLTGLAGRLGVARSTVFKWRDDFPEFDQACIQGMAGAVYWWEQRAHESAMKNTGSPATIIFALKNRAPEDWRDVQRTEHTGADGGPIRVSATDLTDDQLAAIAAAGSR